jgi:hypothetical protein
MKKLAAKNLLTIGLVLAAALGLFAAPAPAYVYDDFTSAGIDTSRWNTANAGGLFSQPDDGYLYFNDSTGGQTGRLRSANAATGAFFVALQYAGFQAGNMQPGFELKSSALQLVLGYGSGSATNAVFLAEAKNEAGQFIQAMRRVGETTSYLSNAIFNNYDSGWLGIGYNGILGPGGQVVLSYDFGAGWTPLASCDPNFTQAPYFSLVGSDQYGTSLSFQVDQVQLNPVPLPPGVWLLGSGLLGLAGLGRRLKQS